MYNIYVHINIHTNIRRNFCFNQCIFAEEPILLMGNMSQVANDTCIYMYLYIYTPH